MATQLNETGLTNFGGSQKQQSPLGFGLASRFFSKFFARKAVPELVSINQETPKDGYVPPPPQSGDTIVTYEPLAIGTANRRGGIPVLTEAEMNRKSRYKEYEVMDEYPEIGSAFDIYADDCSQKSLKGDRWEIETDDTLVKDTVEELFKELRLEDSLWDISRNTSKYGDCFCELVVDINKPKEGIKKLKILDPNYIFRIEDEYGQLLGFVQQIPDRADWDAMQGQGNMLNASQYIALSKYQIVHFRLINSDPAFYPYGKSVGALARQIFRSLKLMEDAMLIYRLARAPERRIFYIDTGSLPASKAQAHVENVKKAFKQEKYYSRYRNNIDGRFNPMSPDEDFFVPVSGRNSNTKIETLKGAENLGEVDDVKYFRDKLLAALKVPKDYVVEKDSSPERKANLSQLDVKFARVIVRVQRCIEIGLEAIAQRHLVLKGFPAQVAARIKVNLPEPSDMFIKRKMDVDEQKARVVQAVLGLQIFPKKKVYKDYYNLTDDEIEQIEQELQSQNQDDMRNQNKLAMQGQMGAMGMQGMVGGQPGATQGLPGQGAPMRQDKGTGMDGGENAPPTQNEALMRMKRRFLLEGKTIEANNIEKLMIKSKKSLISC